MSKVMIRYAQARFSALSNIVWCISNDLIIMETLDAKTALMEGNRPAKKAGIRRFTQITEY